MTSSAFLSRSLNSLPFFLEKEDNEKDLQMGGGKIGIEMNENGQSQKIPAFYAKKTEIFNPDSESTTDELHSLKELFDEGCCSLYSEILDCLNQDTDSEPCSLRFFNLENRQKSIEEEGRKLCDLCTQNMGKVVELKLKTVEKAMQQLHNKRMAQNCGGEHSARRQLKNWLEEKENCPFLISDFNWELLTPEQMQRVVSEQQILQLEIETTGRSLVKTVRKNLGEFGRKHDGTVSILVKRWHALWLRSLEAQCKVERLLQEDRWGTEIELSFDSDCSEPEVKRPRFGLNCWEMQRDNCEGKEENNLSEDEENGSNQKAMACCDSAIFPLKTWKVLTQDVGYSSGGNSVQEMHMESCKNGCNLYSNCNADDCKIPESSLKNSELNGASDSDLARRQRIEFSPVRSFYKTVPLDDAGATDTESPRVNNHLDMVKIADFIDNHADISKTTLGDSLIVNLGDVSMRNDIQDVLCLLDDEPELNRSEEFRSKCDKLHRKQGTKWREFKGNANESVKSSNDSDNELSELEEKSHIWNGSEMMTSFTEMPSYSFCTSSLKRKSQNSSENRQRNSFKIPDFDLDFFDEMDRSIYSTCSNMMDYSRHFTVNGPVRKKGPRKRLRAKRLARCMSDGEHLGLWLNARKSETIPTSMLTTNEEAETMLNDDEPIDQSDAASVWQWDDYNPPVHCELWLPPENCEPFLDSSFISCDDYLLHLDRDTASSPCGELTRFINKSRLQLGMVFEEYRAMNRQELETLMVTCETNVRCLNVISRDFLNHDEKCTKEDYSRVTFLLKQWQDLLFSLKSLADSSLEIVPFNNRGNSKSLIYDEMKRLAKSLQDLIRDGSLDHSFTTNVPFLQCFQDVDETLESFQEVRMKLRDEKERLRILFKTYELTADDNGEMHIELSQLYKCCDLALESCAHQISQLEHLKESWLDWEELQRNLKLLMAKLSGNVAKLELFNRNRDENAGKPDEKVVYSELEQCQDRINSLETTCNYLASNFDQYLSIDSKTTPDFLAEFATFKKMFSEIASRFSHLPGCENVPPRKSDENAEFQPESGGVFLRIWTVFRTNSPVNLCVLLLFLLGVTSFCALVENRPINNWRHAWGPQLDYVKGPPPV